MLVYEGAQTELSGECVLGRQRDCGVVLREGGTSRKHARVFLADGSWWIEDLESANGTKLNGSRIDGRKGLRNGDSIRIGDSELQFHCHERESAPPAQQQGVRLDPQSLEGRTIGGYVIGRLFGRSGMGFLYRAQQSSLQRTVAFKVFARSVVESDPQFAARFRELASKAGSLVHDGFALLHENGVEDGLVWYSMELVEGDTLAALLERDTRLPPELALLTCERVALAMAEAHRSGVIHRNLSLRTLMLTPQGKVKIFDLGIAALLGRGRDLGKPEAAWHTAADATPTSTPQPADDVYALGCLLFHLLSGRPPFQGANAEVVRRAHAADEIPSLRAVAPGLPVAAEELFQGMLTKNRDWRLADMAEVAARLRGLREKVGGASPAAGQTDRASDASGRVDIVKKRQEQRVLRRVIIISCWGLAAVLAVLVLPGVVRSFDRAPEAVDEPIRPSQPQPPKVVNPLLAEPVPGKPPPADPIRQPSTPTVLNDPNLAQVRALRARLAQAATLGWSKVEAEAAVLAASVPAGTPAEAELRLVRQQLADDADAWYNQELAKLPKDVASAGARLTALSRLRDESGSGERADADARYQVELTSLVQRLNEAKRQARRALESGKAGELPRIADVLAPAFAGTPVAGLQRQFANLCTEAAGVAVMWNTDWRTTTIAFERQKGERALAAAASLLLTGDPARARRVLLGDPMLGEQPLVRRRDALVSGLAAILAFDDPTDMQYLDIISGEPAMAGGALVGRAADASGLACTVPVGGGNWTVDMALVLATAEAEVVLSCMAGGEAKLMLRLAEGQLVVKHGTAERTAKDAIAGNRRVRLTCRAGDLRILIDGREFARFEKSLVPAGAQLRLELAGSDWKLDELQVIGGR